MKFKPSVELTVEEIGDGWTYGFLIYNPRQRPVDGLSCSAVPSWGLQGRYAQQVRTKPVRAHED